LTCEHAKISIDTDIAGKMDPYVAFSIVDDKTKKVIWTKQTKAHMGGHQTPKWNEKIDIPITDKNHSVNFSVFEKDTFTDDFLGSGSFKPSEF